VFGDLALLKAPTNFAMVLAVIFPSLFNTLVKQYANMLNV